MFLVFLAHHRERKNAKQKQIDEIEATQRKRDEEAIAKALGSLGGAHHAMTPEEVEAERIRRNVLGSLGSTSYSTPRQWDQHKDDKRAATYTEAERIVAAAEDFAELEEAFEEGEITAQEFQFLLKQLMDQGGANEVTEHIQSTMDRRDIEPLMTEEEEAAMEMEAIMKAAQEAEAMRKMLMGLGKKKEEKKEGDEDDDDDEDEDGAKKAKGPQRADAKDAASDALHPDWLAKKDPKTGRTYYVNKKTRESSWKKPAPLSKAGNALAQAAGPASIVAAAVRAKRVSRRRASGAAHDAAKRRAKIETRSAKDKNVPTWTLIKDADGNMTARKQEIKKFWKGSIKKVVNKNRMAAAFNAAKEKKRREKRNSRRRQSRRGRRNSPPARRTAMKDGDDGLDAAVAVKKAAAEAALKKQQQAGAAAGNAGAAAAIAAAAAAGGAGGDADALHPDWIAKKDPRSGRSYYVNKKTRESSWTKPAGLVKAVNALAKAAGPAAT